LLLVAATIIITIFILVSIIQMDDFCQVGYISQNTVMTVKKCSFLLIIKMVFIEHRTLGFGEGGPTYHWHGSSFQWITR